VAVILGINTFHAGASAALLVDGRPVVAIAEERLNRVKYYGGFPALAIRKCLDTAGLTFKNIDYVAVGGNSASNWLKKMEYVLKHPAELPDLLKISGIRGSLNDIKPCVAAECGVDLVDLRFRQFNLEHHIAHIASAYFVSPWENCAGFSIDGSGDFVTCMFARCRGNKIDVVHRVSLPHSLGLFYTMVCEFLGYKKYGDEGKVMGLAPYGRNKYARYFEDMVSLTGKSFKFNPKYFVPFSSDEAVSVNENGKMVGGGRHYSEYMVELFGEPRKPFSGVEERDRDLAFGVQRLFEKVYMHILNVLYRMVPEDRVAMAGGSVLNSVANGKIFDHTPFRKTMIQPAAGDEGLALGAALYVSRSVLKEKARYIMTEAYLGPEYSDTEIKAALERHSVPCRRLSRDDLLKRTVEEIEKGSVVGWFQERMEWGPRALGNRSILANPSLGGMKEVLNARVKKREKFRPFASSVLAERQAEIFERPHPSPFMQHVYKIRAGWRGRLAAVTHVDDTCRLQSVRREENALYYDLIKLYGERTGVPVLLNTSFNENEPIVACPDDAIKCFLRTKMDVLVIGSFICRKDQDETRY